MDEQLIYSFPNDEKSISSLATDENGNIYGSISRSKEIFRITPNGNLITIYRGTIYGEGDYAHVFYNKKYGVISVENGSSLIVSTSELINSVLIDDDGNEYQSFDGHILYNLTVGRAKWSYQYIFSPIIIDDRDVEPYLIKFKGTDIFTLTRGGYILFNDRLINRLENYVLFDTELFILDNNTYVIKTNGYLTQYYFNGGKIKELVVVGDPITVSQSGNCIFVRRTRVYRLNLLFAINPDPLVKICVKFIRRSGGYELKTLPLELIELINNP